MGAAVIGIVAALPAQLLGNPQGGVVTAGSASISQSTPARVDVNQRSQKAIIDWRGFDIAPGEHTNFDHPSSAAATLNRVNGAGASHINGQLTANGQVFVINQNGIVFGRGARVDVAGLVASTSDIANENFLEGRYVFDNPSPNPDAAIANLGHIQIADNGFAVLAARAVRNDGVIRARLGRVALAGVDTFTLDFEGDGLLSFGIGDEVSTPPQDAEGKPVSELVSNTGTIIADGGVIELSARAATGTVLERVINMEGAIRTRAVDVQGGTIILSGGAQGVVVASGTLDASGSDDGQIGGTVKVLGEKVELLDGAVVDVSGDAGGGKALIGGNFQGSGPEPNSTRTYVANDVSVNADALREGDGGQVIVWADGAASIHGKLTARGGGVSGNGGLVETSGTQSLFLTSTPDASAHNGSGGTWLVDPGDITIVNGSVETVDPGEIDANSISKTLTAGANFTLDTRITQGLPGPGNITQKAGANIEKKEEGGTDAPATLALLAENSIFLNASISSTLNHLNVIVNADSDGSGPGETSAGAIRMNPGSVIISNSGKVVLGGGRDPENNPAVGTIDDIDGILIDGGTIDSGDGKISLRGTGYSAGTEGNLDNASGIDIRNQGSLTSRDGDISLVGGGGGDGTGTRNRGINTQGNALVESTGSGSVGLDGTGGNGINDTTGIFLSDNSTIRSGTGAISLIGRGGDGGIISRGVRLQGGSTVISTADAAITLNGTPGGTDTNSILATSGSGLTTSGETTLEAGPGDIGLDTDNDFRTVAIVSANNVALRDINAIDLGASVVSGNLDVFADGTITESGSLSIVSGTTTLHAGTVTPANIILNDSNDFDTIVIENGSDVTINDINNLILDPSTRNRMFAGTNSLSAFANNTLTINTNITTTGGAVNLRSGGSFTVGNIIDIETQGGNATIDAETITALGSLDIRTNGGNIAVNSRTGDIPFRLFLFPDSSSGSGVGGTIDVAAQGDVFMSGRPLNADSSGPLGGGAVNITSNTGVVDIGSVDSSSISGAGGQIAINADGSIFTGRLTSTGSSQGGNIALSSNNGGITTDFATEGPPLNPIDSSATAGVGGNVNLTAASNIAVGSINATGPTGGGAITLEGNGIEVTNGTLATSDGTVTLKAGTVTLNGNIDAGGGPIRFETDNLAIFSPVESRGGTLWIRPLTVNEAIILGDFPFESTTVRLTASELAFLQDGFSSITIGREDGNHTINVFEAEFRDPVIIQTPAGGSITVDASSACNGKCPPGLLGLGDASIELVGSGETTFLSADIVTSGEPIVIEDSVVLEDDVLLSTTREAPLGANITIDGNVTSEILNVARPHNLELDAGTAGNASAVSVAGLNTLRILQSDMTTFLGAVQATTIDIVNTAQRVVFEGFVTTAEFLTAPQPYAVVFNSGGQIGPGPSVATGVNFGNLGGVTIGNDAGDEFTVFGDLESTAGPTTLAGTVRTFAGTVPSTGSMTFDTVSVAASTTLDSSNGGAQGGGDIILGGTVDGPNSLGLKAGTGGIIFSGDVGNVIRLTGLDAEASDILLGNVKTTGDQTYSGTVTLNGDYSTEGGRFNTIGGTVLGSDTTVTTSGGNIILGGNLDGPNSLDLAAGTTGNISAVSVDGLNTLRILQSDMTTFSGAVQATTIDIVDTAQSVVFDGFVTTAEFLTAPQPYAVVFNSGGQIGPGPSVATGVNFGNLGGVTIGNDAGDEFTVFGDLDSTAGPTTLAGTVRTLAGNIPSTGSMTFDTVSVAASTTLDSSNGGAQGGGDIILGGTVDGPNSLDLAAGTTGNISAVSVDGLNTLRILQSDMTTFSGAVQATTIDIVDTVKSVVFDGFVEAAEFLTAPKPYAVVFNGGGQIGPGPSVPLFGNLGGVTIGNDAGDEFTVFGDLDSTAGPTTLAGTVRTLAGNIPSTGSMTFDTVSVAASTTLDSSNGGTDGGGSINFSGSLNGANPLTLIAGSGNIHFQGNVNVASVEVQSANNVLIDDSFATSGPADFRRYSGNLDMLADAELDVASMFVDPSALGAKLFGSVNGKAGDDAAREVTGPEGDVDFTINGCVIGVPCGEPSDPPSIPPTVEPYVPGLRDPVASELYVIEPPQLLTLFDAKQPSSDPRESQYSNFGNEELWDQSE